MTATLKWLRQRPDELDRLWARGACAKLLVLALFLFILRMVGAGNDWSSSLTLALLRAGFLGIFWAATYLFFRWQGTPRWLAGTLTAGIASTTFIV